jgi:hypothetical protein
MLQSDDAEHTQGGIGTLIQAMGRSWGFWTRGLTRVTQYPVLVSSPQQPFEQERAALEQALLRLPGVKPIVFQQERVLGLGPREASHRYVDQSAVVILLLGKRPDAHDPDVSYTRDEFYRARDTGAIVLIYVRAHPDFPQPLSAGLSEWERAALADYEAREFTDDTDLVSMVLPDLMATLMTTQSKRSLALTCGVVVALGAGAVGAVQLGMYVAPMIWEPDCTSPKLFVRQELECTEQRLEVQLRELSTQLVYAEHMLAELDQDVVQAHTETLDELTLQNLESARQWQEIQTETYALAGCQREFNDAMDTRAAFLGSVFGMSHDAVLALCHAGTAGELVLSLDGIEVQIPTADACMPTRPLDLQVMTSDAFGACEASLTSGTHELSELYGRLQGAELTLTGYTDAVPADTCSDPGLRTNEALSRARAEAVGTAMEGQTAQRVQVVAGGVHPLAHRCTPTTPDGACDEPADAHARRVEIHAEVPGAVIGLNCLSR